MESNTNRVNSVFLNNGDQRPSTSNSSSPFKLPPSRPPSQLSDVSTDSSVSSSLGKSPCHQCSILKDRRLTKEFLERSSSKSPTPSPKHRYQNRNNNHRQPQEEQQPGEATEWRPTTTSTPLHQRQASKAAGTPRELFRAESAPQTEADKSAEQFQAPQLNFDNYSFHNSPPSPPKAMSTVMSKAAAAIAVIFITSILVIFTILHRLQPLPFIDEVFHIPQAQKYCVENNFSSVRTWSCFLLFSILTVVFDSLVGQQNYDTTWPLFGLLCHNSTDWRSFWSSTSYFLLCQQSSPDKCPLCKWQLRDHLGNAKDETDNELKRKS